MVDLSIVMLNYQRVSGLIITINPTVRLYDTEKNFTNFAKYLDEMWFPIIRSLVIPGWYQSYPHFPCYCCDRFYHPHKHLVKSLAAVRQHLFSLNISEPWLLLLFFPNVDEDVYDMYIYTLYIYTHYIYIHIYWYTLGTSHQQVVCSVCKISNDIFTWHSHDIILNFSRPLPASVRLMTCCNPLNLCAISQI